MRDSRLGARRHTIWDAGLTAGELCCSGGLFEVLATALGAVRGAVGGAGDGAGVLLRD